MWSISDIQAVNTMPEEFNWMTDNGLAVYVHNNVLPNLLRWHGPTSSGIILDFGCGTGETTNTLSDLFNCRVIGIDIDRHNVRRKGEFVICSGSFLPFIDNTFSSAFCLGVLHHIPGWGTALKEIQRTLNNNGLVVGNEPNALHPHMSNMPLLNKIADAIVKTGERAIDYRTLTAAFKDSGFTVKEMRSTLGLKFLSTPIEFILRGKQTYPVYLLMEKIDFMIPFMFRSNISFCLVKV